jgi:hypothetical protein
MTEIQQVIYPASISVPIVNVQRIQHQFYCRNIRVLLHLLFQQIFIRAGRANENPNPIILPFLYECYGRICLMDEDTLMRMMRTIFNDYYDMFITAKQTLVWINDNINTISYVYGENDSNAINQNLLVIIYVLSSIDFFD